jgi:hypothetical protein
MWSVVNENAHLVHLKEVTIWKQITNETKFEFLTTGEEESGLLCISDIGEMGRA